MALAVSLPLPYAASLVRQRLADAWQMRLYGVSIDEFARAGRHTLADWFDDDARDRDVPFMASEAHQILSHAVEWYQSLIGDLTLVVFLAGVLAVLFSSGFGGAYALAIILGMAMSRWFQARDRRALAEEQNAQAAISMRLLGSWDNIVLGNVYNRRNWERKAKEELEALASVRERIRASETLQSVLVFLVVVGPVAMQFVRELGLTGADSPDGLALARLLIAVPWALQALTRLPSLFLSVHLTPRVLEQLAKVDESLGKAVGEGGVNRNSPLEVCHDEGPHVEWQSLAFLHQGIVERMRGLDALATLTKNFRPGRYMVIGPAGSGKTTLMLMLKARHLARSFYFPGQNTLVFDGGTESLFDPVEKLVACLNQIRLQSEGGIILLDDWDVYLDAWSAEQVGQVIDDIAQVRCVIETRRVNASEI
jgi:ABC-type transport system involved in cytochrome bd biosynthesis fused ATPase/permease subunit